MKSLRSLWWASGSFSKAHNGTHVVRRTAGSGYPRPSCGSRVALTSPSSCTHHAASRRCFANSSLWASNGSSPAESEGRIADPTLPERFRAVMRQMPHPVVVITTLDCPPRRNRDDTPPSHWTRSDVLDSMSSSSSSPGTGKNAPGQHLRPVPRAMTVSSFTSLSLRPRERVLFNIALPSRTYHAIFCSGRFNAHVLTGDEHGARIADLFTKGYGGLDEGSAPSGGSGLGVLAGLSELGVGVLGREEWDAEWDSAAPGEESERGRMYTAPLLKGRGVMHVLKCDLYTPRYLDNKPAEDSALLVGKAGDGHDNFAIMLGEVTEIVHGSESDGVVEGGDIALAYADGAYRRPGKQVLKHAIALPPKR